jgi:hypothetical protein
VNPPSFGRVLLSASLLIAIAACGGAQLPQPTRSPDPTAAPASVTPSPTTAPTEPPTPAPAMSPSPGPLATAAPAAPTPTPIEVVATIMFAHNVSDDSGVKLLNVDSTFELGDNIAWKTTLPAAQGTESMEVVIVNAATGARVNGGTFTPGVGSDTFYGDATDLVTQPGTYLMRYYSNSTLVSEGQFTVTAATPTQAPEDECDPSYPTVCIPSGPPDLDCGDVPFDDFKVRGDDPHGFDGDHDGIGCESGGGGGAPSPTKKPSGGGGGGGNCDPSYPTLCLPSSPDLDCGEINARNFPVVGRDPHGFDGDNDGIGCET